MNQSGKWWRQAGLLILGPVWLLSGSFVLRDFRCNDGAGPWTDQLLVLSAASGLAVVALLIAQIRYEARCRRAWLADELHER